MREDIGGYRRVCLGILRKAGVIEEISLLLCELRRSRPLRGQDLERCDEVCAD